jgi:hypothetical protein
MTAQPPAEARQSEVSRIVNVFIDPKKAFSDIVARPGWIVPVVLMMVAAVAFVFLFSSHIGWESAMRKMDETNTRMQQMDPQARENVIQQQVKFAPIFGYVFGAGGVPIYVLIVAGVTLLMCKMMGAALDFKHMFAITAYGMLPGLIFTVLAIAVMFLKSPDDFNLQNPLFFNIGAFLEPPPNTGKFIYSLASSIDLFSFWDMALLATGISVAVKKFPFSKALTAVAIPWVVWILVKAAWAVVTG